MICLLITALSSFDVCGNSAHFLPHHFEIECSKPEKAKEETKKVRKKVIKKES